MSKYSLLGLAICLAFGMTVAIPVHCAMAAVAPSDSLMQQLEGNPDLLSPAARGKNGVSSNETGDWRVTCYGKAKNRCEVSQTVKEAKSDMRALYLLVTIDPDTKKRMLVITVPYDVFLPEGVALQFAEGDITIYPYDACNSEGCFVKVEMGDALFETFKRGGAARVLIANLERKVIPLAFSLRGFKDAAEVL